MTVMNHLRIFGFFLWCACVWTGLGFSEEASLPLVNQIVLVDNYETGTDRNSVGGTSQGDEEYPGGCIPTKIREGALVFGGRGTSLQLDYDVVVPNSFSYYWTKVGPPDLEPGSSSSLDLTPYKYLSFWIKTSEVAPRFGVELHQDADDDHFFILGKDVVSKVPATRFISGENVGDWRKVVIPFASFKQIKDWSKVLEIVFVFENKNRSKRGKLYLDDILFGSTEPLTEEIPRTIEKKDVFGFFKVNGAELNGQGVALQPNNPTELSLKTIPPDLEKVQFEVSMDEGQTWAALETFYEHALGATYRFDWTPGAEFSGKDFLLRASVSDIVGQTSVIAGPYQMKG